MAAAVSKTLAIGDSCFGSAHAVDCVARSCRYRNERDLILAVVVLGQRLLLAGMLGPRNSAPDSWAPDSWAQINWGQSARWHRPVWGTNDYRLSIRLAMAFLDKGMISAAPPGL